MSVGKKGVLSPEERKRLEDIRLFLENLAKKYHFTSTDVLQFLHEEDILIPTSLFTPDLSVLETVVKYLKENHKLNYQTIGQLLNRDQRNIWHTYAVTKKKYPNPLLIQPSKTYIPVSIFQHATYSPLECVVHFLKDSLGLTYRQIADLLHRDQRTIWTVNQRVKKKQ